MNVTEVAQVVLAIAVAALVAFGVLSSWFRRGVVARVVRAVWRMASEEDREQDRQRASAAARKDRLRSAVGVLSEGHSMGLMTYDSAIKIGQAIAEFRSEGPSELEPHLEAIVAFVERSLDMRDGAITTRDVDRLMKPVTEIVRTELNRLDH